MRRPASQELPPPLQKAQGSIQQEMANYSRDSEERDAITGARRQYNKAIKRIGAFLTNRDWVATDRKITIIDESGATMNLNETYGELDFERLSNGNLRANLEIRHVPDDFLISYSYIVALDPNKKTFIATREDTTGLTAFGSINQLHNSLYWMDISERLGAGSTIGDTCVRSMNFISLGNEPAEDGDRSQIQKVSLEI